MALSEGEICELEGGERTIVERSRVDPLGIKEYLV